MSVNVKGKTNRILVCSQFKSEIEFYIDTFTLTSTLLNVFELFIIKANGLNLFF